MTTARSPRDGVRRGLVERLAAGPVICAEGFLFELERRGYLAAGEFVPEVALDHPEGWFPGSGAVLRTGAVAFPGHLDLSDL